MQAKKWLPLAIMVALLGWAAWRGQRSDYDDPTTARQTGVKQPGSSQHYSGVAVVDGDTIRLPNGELVRLCGIDAPEVAHGNRLGQPVREAAKAKLRSLIAAAGGAVIVSPVEYDRYGRLVAEVFVAAGNPQQPEEEKLLNDELVRSGMAYHYWQYSGTCPNGSEALERAEQEARGQRLGVWAGDYQQPWEFRQKSRERSM